VDSADITGALSQVLYTKSDIERRLAELGAEIGRLAGRIADAYFV